jgi:hypothetical protein
MPLRLIPGNEFVTDLEARGFERTEFTEAGVDVWELKGKFYTVPLPVHTEFGHILYCPFAIELFYSHVLGTAAKCDTDDHDQKAYKVLPTKNS